MPTSAIQKKKRRIRPYLSRNIEQDGSGKLFGFFGKKEQPKPENTTTSKNAIVAQSTQKIYVSNNEEDYEEDQEDKLQEAEIRKEQAEMYEGTKYAKHTSFSIIGSTSAALRTTGRKLTGLFRFMRDMFSDNTCEIVLLGHILRLEDSTGKRNPLITVTTNYIRQILQFARCVVLDTYKVPKSKEEEEALDRLVANAFGQDFVRKAIEYSRRKKESGKYDNIPEKNKYATRLLDFCQLIKFEKDLFDTTNWGSIFISEDGAINNSFFGPAKHLILQDVTKVSTVFKYFNNLIDALNEHHKYRVQYFDQYGMLTDTFKLKVAVYSSCFMYNKTLYNEVFFKQEQDLESLYKNISNDYDKFPFPKLEYDAVFDTFFTIDKSITRSFTSLKFNKSNTDRSDTILINSGKNAIQFLGRKPIGKLMSNFTEGINNFKTALNIPLQLKMLSSNAKAYMLLTDLLNHSSIVSTIGDKKAKETNKYKKYNYTVYDPTFVKTYVNTIIHLMRCILVDTADKDDAGEIIKHLYAMFGDHIFKKKNILMDFVQIIPHNSDGFLLRLVKKVGNILVDDDSTLSTKYKIHCKSFIDFDSSSVQEAVNRFNTVIHELNEHKDNIQFIDSNCEITDTDQLLTKVYSYLYFNKMYDSTIFKEKTLDKFVSMYIDKNMDIEFPKLVYGTFVDNMKTGQDGKQISDGTTSISDKEGEPKLFLVFNNTAVKKSDINICESAKVRRKNKFLKFMGDKICKATNNISGNFEDVSDKCFIEENKCVAKKSFCQDRLVKIMALMSQKESTVDPKNICEANVKDPYFEDDKKTGKTYRVCRFIKTNQTIDCIPNEESRSKQVGGSHAVSYKKTDQRVQVGNRSRIVYIDTKGKKYIKQKDSYMSIPRQRKLSLTQK